MAIFSVRESRGYGINYINFTGALDECLLNKKEMEDNVFENGDGDPFSYDVVVEDDESGCLVYPELSPEGLRMIHAWAPNNACSAHVFLFDKDLDSFINDLFREERIPVRDTPCGEYWIYSKK